MRWLGTEQTVIYAGTRRLGTGVAVVDVHTASPTAALAGWVESQELGAG